MSLFIDFSNDVCIMFLLLVGGIIGMFSSRYQRLHGSLHSGGATCFHPFVRLGDNGMFAVRLPHCTAPVRV